MERVNSDLANTLGNLVNRTISMSNKNLAACWKTKALTETVDADLKAVVTGTRDKVAEKMISCVWQMPSAKYLPYSNDVTNTLTRLCHGHLQRRDKTGSSGYRSLQSGREHQHRCILVKELYAETSEKIFAQLNTKDREFDDLATFGLQRTAIKRTETPETFQRQDIKEVLGKVEAHHPKKEEPAEEKAEDEIKSSTLSKRLRLNMMIS